MKTELWITLEHDEVLQIICNALSNEEMRIEPEDLTLDLQEYRVNEGYGGPGPDQPARIKKIIVRKTVHDQ